MKKDNKRIPFKVLWKNPFYNAVIKMGLWIVFFILIYLGVFISNSMGNNYNNNSSNEKKDVIISYQQMKKDLVSNNLNIKYKVGDYYISGEINDGVLIATLEDESDSLIKFKYDGENIYQIKKEEESLKNDLFTDINIKYFLPSKIIEILDDPKNISIKGSDGLSYSYNIDNVAYTAYLNNKNIEKIIILDNEITYELDYEVGNENK